MTDRKILESLINKYGKETILNELRSATYFNAYEKAKNQGRANQAKSFAIAGEAAAKKERRQEIEDEYGHLYTKQLCMTSRNYASLLYSIVSDSKGFIGFIWETPDYNYIFLVDDTADAIELLEYLDNWLIDDTEIVSWDTFKKELKHKLPRSCARDFVEYVADITDDNEKLDWHDFANL